MLPATNLYKTVWQKRMNNDSSKIHYAVTEAETKAITIVYSLYVVDITRLTQVDNYSKKKKRKQ